MLNKLPRRVMETILGRLGPPEYLELAFVSLRMWKIVEETPKKYEVAHFMEDGSLDHSRILWNMAISRPGMLQLALTPISQFVFDAYLQHANISGDLSDLVDDIWNIGHTLLFRLLLSNSTMYEIRCMPLSFGIELWSSLNMKVTRITEPSHPSGESALPQLIQHFKPAELICQHFFRRFVVENRSAARKLVVEELVYPMETLHISFIASALKFLELLRAKDLRITCEPPTRNASTNILNFLAGKIQNWLCGTIEIDKLQLITDGEKLGTAAIEKFIDHLARTVEPELGWVDRTYKGMELILRASDGQALIYYWDARPKCLGLFRCEYNFRRGRCLGSYQRNGDSLSRISKLMGISLRLAEQNPELAENAKEKLKDECIKFNAYNKGATTLDLLTDVIWRPKGNPRSLWGTRGNTMAQPEIYPVDLTLDHAYKFTKAFEARGVLPEVDEFKPASRQEIEPWNDFFADFIV